MTDKALVVNGTANELIRTLDTPEACAAFFIEHQESYDAINIVWRHVKDNLMLAGRQGTPVAAGGGRLVLVEPAGYDVDQDVVKELAPDCIKVVELESSDAAKRIHELAGEALEQVIVWEEINVDELERRLKEIVTLSQPQTVEQVDGRKLQVVLGRGDKRALDMIARNVKRANKWRLATRVPEGQKA